MQHDDPRNTDISDVEVDDVDLDEIEHTAPLGDLDDEALHEIAPETAVAESLRNALGEMRGEADRIAGLETGDEQVQAAERFAEAAGSLDEQISSSARADDDARS